MKKWFIIAIWIMGTIGGWRLALLKANLSTFDEISITLFYSFISFFIPLMLYIGIQRAREQKEKDRKWQEKVKKYNLQDVTLHGEQLSYGYDMRNSTYKKYFFPINDPPKEIKIKNKKGDKEFIYLLKE